MIWRDKTFDIRYRVGEVVRGIIDEDNPTLVVEKVREFKSARHALAYQNLISLDGTPAVMQAGVVCWMSDLDVSKEVDRLYAEGWNLQQ